MAKEIERKFLVTETWHLADPHPAYGSARIVQAYLTTSDSPIVRVRIYGEKAYLTVKGKTEGISRDEYEYEIPIDDAKEMMRLAPTFPIEKIRYRIPFDNHIFEIDVFCGANEGLVLAEVELSSPDDLLSLPDWIGEEVSADPRYFNAHLAKHPFTTW